MCGASGSHIWPAEPAVLEPFCAMDSLLPISHFKDPSSLDAVTFGQALHVTYAAGAFHFNSFKLEMRAAPGGNANKKKNGCATLAASQCHMSEQLCSIKLSAVRGRRMQCSLQDMQCICHCGMRFSKCWPRFQNYITQIPGDGDGDGAAARTLL